MVRGCPDLSVLFSTQHTEDNWLESFAHTDLSPGVLALVSGHAVKGTGFDRNRMLQWKQGVGGWVYHGNVWGLDDPSLKTLLTHAYFLPVLIFTHGVLLFCPSLVFCSLEVFVLVLVYVLVSICLAGLCAVWNYTPGRWAHTFSGAPVIALLGPCLWLWARLHHSHSVFLHCSLASSLLFFALSSTPLLLFSPCMAHYGWSPPAQSGNSLYKHTHIIQSHSAVFRAACWSGGLCTICYKTALLIVFGREMETILPSHFFPPPTGANRQFLNSVLAVRALFFTKPGPSTSAPALYTFASDTGF